MAFVLPLMADSNAHESSPALITPKGSLLLYYNVEGPLNFSTLTPKNLPPGAQSLGPVKTKKCQYGLSLPLAPGLAGLRGGPSLSGAGGRSGLNKLMEELRRERPELTGIYDVKIDLHKTNILTLFSRYCVEITALGYH